MKKHNFLCGFLAIIVLLCSGCEYVKKFVSKETNVQSIKQVELSDVQLTDAIERIDFSALVASLSTELDLINPLSVTAYIGDANSDGINELVCGYPSSGFLFQRGDKKEAAYFWAQSSQEFLVDKDNILYISDSLSGPTEDGSGEIDGSKYFQWYSKWNGTEWEAKYSKSGEFDSKGEIEKTTYYSGRSEKEIFEQEFEKIGFSKYDERAQKFTTCTFEAQYYDHLINELNTYLGNTYSSHSMATNDIDGDGTKEAVFVVHNVLDTWLNDFYQSDYNDFKNYAENDFNLSHKRTVVLILDIKGEEIKVSAHATSSQDSFVASQVVLNKYYISTGSNSIFTSTRIKDLSSLSDEDRESLYQALENHYKDNGYSDIFFKKADIADMKGDELICICKKSGNWQMILLTFNSETPYCFTNNILSSSANYIINYKGKPSFLLYSQNLYQSSKGDQYNYAYTVSRYDDNGAYISLETQEITIKGSDGSSTKNSEFFAAFNTHIGQDLIVIHDPYLLSGQQWMSGDDISYGARPAQTVTAEVEDIESKIGVIDISDGWLNLREGPGTDYDQVLTDPSDPKSIVKQPLGAPVTILEEVKTKDKDNPVWVKIRIKYNDKVLVGYSSKKYIKVLD